MKLSNGWEFEIDEDGDFYVTPCNFKEHLDGNGYFLFERDRSLTVNDFSDWRSLSHPFFTLLDKEYPEFSL